MLTRKHSKAIAEMVARYTVPHTTYPGDMVQLNFVNALADYFVADNPRFDRERFLSACGIEPGSEHLCEQCKTDMGSEWILGPVCGKCCRKNRLRIQIIQSIVSGLAG